MRLFRRPDHPPVGLEISGGGIKLLQLNSRPDGATQAILAARPLPPASRLDFDDENGSRDGLRTAAELARQMLAELRWPRRVVTCLPEGGVRLRTLRIAAQPGDGPPDLSQLDVEAAALFAADLRVARTQYLYAGVARHVTGPAHEFYVAASPSRHIAAFV